MHPRGAEDFVLNFAGAVRIANESWASPHNIRKTIPSSKSKNLTVVMGSGYEAEEEVCPSIFLEISLSWGKNNALGTCK